MTAHPTSDSRNRYPQHSLAAADGTRIVFTFFGHASLAIAAGESRIYVDPVGAMADYESLPQGDIVLVTHHHDDHLDTRAVEIVAAPGCRILCSASAAAELPGRAWRTMRPGDAVELSDGIAVEAVAAYNTSEGHLQFHPREREDCGYLLSIGGTRIYIAGDTEPTPEMLALCGKVDIAFLPVNQPYTMTVDQAVEAIRELRPAHFFPYHYGQVEERTDIDRLVRELEGIAEVHVYPME